MKRSHLSLIISLVCMTTITLADQGIDFNKFTLDQAMIQASTSGKLVFIDGYTDWCAPCKQMDKEVMSDSELGAFFNENFINIKLDMEKGGLEFAQKYKVIAYPALLFLNGDGEMVHRAAGFQTKKQLIALAKIAMGPNEHMLAKEKRFQAGDRDQILLLDLLNLKYNASDPSYMEVAEAYLNTVPDWDDPLIRQFIVNYLNTTDSPLFDYVLEHKEIFYKELTTAKVYGKIEELVQQKMYSRSSTLEEIASVLSKVYPGQDKQMLSNIKMTYYRERGDRENYALSAIQHYKAYPTDDPFEINDMGVTFVKVVDNPRLLKQAVKLMKKAVKMDDSFYNNDTLAALYFKLGEKSKAKKIAEKAIAQAEDIGADAIYTIELLEDIKKL